MHMLLITHNCLNEEVEVTHSQSALLLKSQSKHFGLHNSQCKISKHPMTAANL